MDNSKYLIIGGSTKCGTTSVFNYFEFHPQVCPCKMKESRFFWTDEYPLTAALRPGYENRSFSNLFENCNAEKIRLEATPDYLYSGESADKIHNTLKNVKFVFILREPVSRLLSWFHFSKVNGLISQSTSLQDYVSMQQQQIVHTPQHLRALEQGNYSGYLEKYISYFGKDRVHICFYEQLVSDPGNFCKGIAQFASIDESYFNNLEFKIYNRTVPTTHVGAHRYFRKFKRMVRPATKMFHPAIRKKIKLAAHHLESTYQAANRDKSENKEVIPPDLQKFFDGYYHDDRQKLNYLVQNKYW